MNQALITNWNNVVKQDDTIYHLGDFAFMKENQVINLLQQLNGRKIFVFGNHDKVMRNHAIQKYFVAMTSYLEVHHNGELICMFHYPIAEHNKCHRGSYHVHGHCHGNYTYPTPCRAMDVGAPCIDYTPINLDAVIERLSVFPVKQHH